MDICITPKSLGENDLDALFHVCMDYGAGGSTGARVVAFSSI